jgi:hypothetical protein
MNKYLMLSAAAVMASTTANAGTFVHSFTFGTSGGGAYCDGGNVYSSGTNIWAWQHTNNNCSGGVSYGQGLVGKNSVTGKSADMSDGLYGNSAFTLNYVLPAKLKNGKPWSLWCQFSGTTSFNCNSGVLTSVVAGHKGNKSTSSGLKALLQLHKSAKRG